jgi:hypothetical protein
MPQEILFSSKEFKQLLDVSDCDLMHMRVSGELKFIKKGSAFLYKLHDKKLLLKHPLANQLFNWYQERRDISLDNVPKESESIDSALLMIETVLLPINNEFGDINITYGFVSAELNKYIQKNSSSGTYPSIDQHSASEPNNADNKICKRHGLACDFTISGYEKEMDKVMNFIVNNLDFDKIYYYGESRPIHVSVGEKAEKHLQIMNVSDKGRRIPGKKAFGNKAKVLAEEQIK